MSRGMVLRTALAAMLCGCQSATSYRECTDCTPPKTISSTYKPPCDNLVTKLTALDCADDALKAMRKNCGKLSNDFQEGFRQAYVDLAMGRPALTPPVPPRRYWTAYYRSCAGQSDVAQWFEGYRAGLDHGAQGGVSQFDRVASSWTGSTAADHALCAPPEMLPAGYGPPPPTPQDPPHGPMGPYGPLLHPTGYQTPPYAAPETPTNPEPPQRVGRMQLDVF